MRATRAFTLVEALIVVLILGALAAIALPRIAQSGDEAKTKACQRNVDIINSQIEFFYANTGDWPNNLNKLTKDEDYFPDGKPECPFGTKYEYNKDTHRVADHDHP